MATSIDIRQIIDLPEDGELELYSVAVTRTAADGTVTGARIPLAQIVGASGGTTPEPGPGPEQKPDPMLKLSADGTGFRIGPDGLPLPGQTITVSLERRDISGKVVWTINRDISIPEDATEVVISGDRAISIELENVAPPMDLRATETSYHGWNYIVTATGESLFVSSPEEAELMETIPEENAMTKVTVDGEDHPGMEFDDDNPPGLFYYNESAGAQHLVRSASDTRVYVRVDVHGMFNMEHNDHAVMTYFMCMSSGGTDEEGNQEISLQHIILGKLTKVREGVYSAILAFSAGELDQDGAYPFNYLIAPGYILPVNDPTKAGGRGGFTIDGLTFISVTNNLEGFTMLGLDDEERIKAFLDAQDHHDGVFTAVGALPAPVIGTDAITISVEADGLEDSIELPVSVVEPARDLVLEAHPASLLKDTDGRPLIGQAAVVRAFPQGLDGRIAWSDNIGLDISEDARKVVISTSLLRSIGTVENIINSPYYTSVGTKPGSSWWMNTGSSGNFLMRHVSSDGEDTLREIFQSGGIRLQDEVPLLPTGLECEVSTSFNLLSGLDGSPMATSDATGMLYIRVRFYSLENASTSGMYCLLNVKVVAEGQDHGEVTATPILTRMHRIDDSECSCIVTLAPGTFQTNSGTPPIQLRDCMILPTNDPGREGRMAKYNIGQVHVIPLMPYAGEFAEIGVSSEYEIEAFLDSSEMSSGSFTPKGFVRNPAIDGTNISISASVDGITKSVMIPFVTED